jgi:hypothetical protein
VTVTFKPTNSTYSFYRLTGANDIARLGPFSFAGVQRAGRDIEYYPPDEVQEMAASELAASVWSVEDDKETDKLTLRRYSIGSDDDVIE